MSMFSEVATEGAIQGFVRQLKAELEADFPAAQSDMARREARAAIKRMGRYALTQFEWTKPDWASEYDDLFAESREGDKW